MTTQPADLINSDAFDRALADVAAIKDPVDRDKAARALQTALTEAIAEPLTRTKAVRQQTVLELRQNLTLAKVAEQLGLSVGRVDQLAKGR
ncbi:sigma factor-like helix-turn-helix DNA-binding protein [Streptomyces sp. YKOK-I1]